MKTYYFIHLEQLIFAKCEIIFICGVQMFLFIYFFFASINRYLASSKKLERRTNRWLTNIFCNFSGAIKISFGIYIIWAFISVHHYFNFTVIYNFCIPKYFILWATWIFYIHCLIPSIFLMIFNTLTLINIRKRSSLLRRNYGNNYRRSFNVLKSCQNYRSNKSNRDHIELQLTSMIITETIATILTTLPYDIYVIYQTIRIENEKSSESLAREDLIEQSIRLTIYVEPSCGFYIYLFTLTTLRKRFLRLLLNKI
jgi:hypothetical protein